MDNVAKYIEIAIIIAFLIPVIVSAIKSACSGLIGLGDVIISTPKKIGKCSCGETIICTKVDNGLYSLVCQNYDCRKSTKEHKYLSQAKAEWEEIREVKC